MGANAAIIKPILAKSQREHTFVARHRRQTTPKHHHGPTQPNTKRSQTLKPRFNLGVLP